MLTATRHDSDSDSDSDSRIKSQKIRERGEETAPHHVEMKSVSELGQLACGAIEPKQYRYLIIFTQKELWINLVGSVR